jgi:serine/threonine-protein kinase
MKLTYASLSTQGPVRPNNEDAVGFWEPTEDERRRTHGSLMVIADGVGGQSLGEVASQTSVDVLIKHFQESPVDHPPRQLLWDMIIAANLAVYDRGMEISRQQTSSEKRGADRMATTLTATLFRNAEATIGHVGDTRAYHVQGGRVQQITADHSYAAEQFRLGLITQQEAIYSKNRNVLMRSIGREPTVQVDLYTVRIAQGDYIVQCCDGVHQFVSNDEIGQIVMHNAPQDACRQLIELAEKRGTEDNLTVQIIRADRVEDVMFYRGLPIYREVAQPMGHEVEVGHTLDGRFEVTDLISRSGMASIFKAKDLQTGEYVALKVPFMQFESDPAFYTRFQREESIGRRLNHPYVLKIVPMEDKSRPYIAMEYLQGQTLRSLLQSMEKLPAADALGIASRVCEALEYLHSQDVIHRDLKPENIMLCEDGSLRLMDFGIAKASGLRRLTFAGFSTSMGTPDYMAPEQVKGKRGDARTDIYSLGVILYEMLTGEMPFEGSNPYAIMHARLVNDPVAPRKINPELSPQIEEIVLHAMERQPYDRYPTAAAMRAELDAPDNVQVTGRSERLRPGRPWQGQWQQWRLYIVAAVIPLIVLLAFLIGSRWHGR